MKSTKNFLMIFLITFSGNYYSANSVMELKQKSVEQINFFTATVLKNHNHTLLNDVFETQYKPLSIHVIINTKQGRKFLKIHDKGNGIREYIGTKTISELLPIVAPEQLITYGNFEIIIQPYIENIHHKLVFNIIENYSTSEAIKIVNNMLEQMLNVVNKNLRYETQATINDFLYFNRLKTQSTDGESGRIERFYKNNIMNLSNTKISWDALLYATICVNGISYKETLLELLDNAYQILNPSHSRLISICHGDWHEMNAYVEILTQNNLNEICYFDCEYSGLNDVIEDAMIYLIYNAIFMSYITPKYYSEQFKQIDNFQTIVQKSKDLNSETLNVKYINNTLFINKFEGLTISHTRWVIIELFIENYLNPIIKKASKLFNMNQDDIENRIKSCIITRLLDLYNLSLMEPEDQSKLIALIFTIVGTPLNSSDKESSLLKLKSSIRNAQSC